MQPYTELIRNEEVRNVANEITIKRKHSLRGEDGHKVISIRIKNELSARLDEIALEANRSRNEVISLLLESAVSIVKVEETKVISSK